MDDLNEMQLNAGQLVALYGRVLVDVNDTIPIAPKASETAKKIKYLGDNKRHVTILVTDREHPFLSEESLLFLTKILSACQLNIGDTAIVNTCSEPDWLSSWPLLQPAKLISFGTEIPGTVKHEFMPFDFQHATCILAPPLAAFTGDPEEAKQLKSKLWVALKQIFRIK